jgi:excisionase family DNA binding protein
MPLMTAAEVAQILRITQQRVYQMARLGQLPSVRVGRRVRFERGAFVRWLDGGGFSCPPDQSQVAQGEAMEASVTCAD